MTWGIGDAITHWFVSELVDQIEMQLEKYIYFQVNL